MIQTSPESGVISKKLLVIGFCCVLIIGSLFFAIAARNKNGTQTATTPTQAVDQFLQATTQSDSTASYAMFTDRLKGELGQETWKIQLEDVFKGYVGAPIYVDTETLTKAQDGTATSQKFTYDLTFEKLGDDTNVTYAMAITVKKEANSWKVDGLSSTKK